MNDQLVMIKEQNDHITKLNAKLAEHEHENEKFKFARSVIYNGRCPGIKDWIGFQPENQNNIKLNAHKNKISNFVKGKALMVQDEHSISFKTFDASFVLTNKSGKVVAKYVGGKHKSLKTCVWVPRCLFLM
jgi:hypothetical protein